MRIVDAVALFSFIIDGGSFFFYIFAPELYNIIINMKNKIRLLMTMLLMAVMGNVWAVEVTFSPSNFTGQGTTGSGSDISATVDGVTFSCDKGYGTTQIRCYKDGEITISSSSSTITKI